VWRLYDYRDGGLPLFVPPGHVLLFLLGVAVAPHLSPTWRRGIVLAAVAATSALVVSGRDTLSGLLLVCFLAAVWRGPNPSLYATMFVLALVMELYGTWLGNWRWNPVIANGWLSTLNPPLTAGTFYAILDLLVLALTRHTLTRFPSLVCVRSAHVSQPSY
jgi:hypothetical protein